MTAENPRAAPLLDRRPGCRAGGRCEGAEWLFITEAEVERLLPIPPPPTLADAEQAAAMARIVDDILVKRGATRNSVYPCRDCNAKAFYRWAGKHWNKDHDRSTCAECRLIEELRGHRRREKAPEILPTPNTDPGPGPGF